MTSITVIGFESKNKKSIAKNKKSNNKNQLFIYCTKSSKKQYLHQYKEPESSTLYPLKSELLFYYILELLKPG